ncbi:hypothetical protein DB320_00470 [Helicobacter pylori]|nr:hypothetical protein DB320_00470 [Helicobacter pylori]
MLISKKQATLSHTTKMLVFILNLANHLTQIRVRNQRIPFNNKDKKLQKAIFKKQLKYSYNLF